MVSTRVEAGQRFPLSFMETFGRFLVEELAPACQGIAVAGSVRRRRAWVKDLELLCVPNPPEDEAMARLFYDELDLRVEERFLARGAMDYRRDSRGRPGFGRHVRLLLFNGRVPVDLFCTTPEAWGIALFVRTSPAGWCRRAMARLRELGMRGHVNEPVTDAHGGPIPCPDEEAVFRLLGWRFVAPEERDRAWRLPDADLHASDHGVEAAL